MLAAPRPEDPLLTPSEAAAWLGFSTARLRALRRDGRIRAQVFAPQTIRYQLTDLQAFPRKSAGRSRAVDHSYLQKRAVALRKCDRTLLEIGKEIGRSVTWVHENLPVNLRGRVTTYHRLPYRFVRLDDVATSNDGSGSSLHDLIAPLVDPFDPQRWVEAELLDALVGDLSIADIQRMSDDQLRPLRAKLIAEGFAPGRSVQQKERERLRDPVRHRGEAPPVMFERMAPRHRGRRAQQELMAGKRTSRKPRKRWERS